MSDDNTPKRFVGLHAHDTEGSIGDGLGTAKEHIDFSRENGMDALASTNHGNMNGFSYSYLHAKELKKKGIDFKVLYGNESYFLPSLSNWSELREQKRIEKLKEKEASKKTKEEEFEEIGEQFPQSKEDLEQIIEGLDEETKGTVIENEEESKSNKWKDPLKQRNHLVLLAKNSEGLKSLFKITSMSYVDGFYMYPRVDFDMLKKYAKGNIIASSACLAGYPGKLIFDNQIEKNYELWKPNNDNFELIQKSLNEMVQRFQDALGKENYYLELQWNNISSQHLLNQHLIECSKRTGAPLICTADSHYARPEFWKEREIYKTLAWMSKTKGAIDKDKIPQKIEELKCELYPKNAQQMWKSYLKYGKEAYPETYSDDNLIKEAIERTYTIAHEQIDKEVEIDKRVKLPALIKLIDSNKIESMKQEFQTENEDELAFKRLKELSILELKNRKLTSNEYVERLKYELETIKELKFAKYFLTYHKVMELIGEKMLTGFGRGSAAGSLVSYLLNITQLDPIKYNLLFERFLTKKKKDSYPDIDSDSSDRDLALKTISEHFGETNVIAVSNFNQLQIRSLIKDLSKLEGIPFDEVNSYTGKIEQEAKTEAKKEPAFDAQLWTLTYEEASKNSPSFREFTSKYPEIEKYIKVLFKQKKSLSRHAGGVCITDNALENMPVIKSKNVLQTPWSEGLNNRHLEQFGFLKFDLLGLGTLRMFEDTIAKILKKQGNKNPTFKEIKKWFYENLHPDNNKMDDLHVYKTVYWNKEFVGCFQFIQEKVHEFSVNLKPSSIDDLSAIIAIFRPGPLGVGADKLYLGNKLNPSSIKWKHPLLKDVLGRTYGVMVYQEQLMLIYHKLAGIPLEDTDPIRKAFTKKDLSNKEKAAQERNRLRTEFVQRCKEINNIDESVSGDIFDDFEKFVAYSFNFAHSACYATTSYICSYLYTYYPDEWTTTYIDYCSNEKGKASGKDDPKAVAISEAIKVGYTIGKPDINISEIGYTINPLVPKQLIPGFSSMKYVGKTASDELKRYKPYNRIEDLLINNDGTWRHSKFNKRSLSTMIKLGALDSIPDFHKFFRNYKEAHDVLVDGAEQLKRIASRKKNNDVRKALYELIEEKKKESITDWDTDTKLKHSIELMGNVDFNLIITDKVRQTVAKKWLRSIDEYDEDGEYWGIIKSCEVRTTKKNTKFLSLRIFAESGKEQGVNIWNFDEKRSKVPDKYSVVALFLTKNHFGLSSTMNSVAIIKAE